VDVAGRVSEHRGRIQVSENTLASRMETEVGWKAHGCREC